MMAAEMMAVEMMAVEMMAVETMAVEMMAVETMILVHRPMAFWYQTISKMALASHPLICR